MRRGAGVLASAAVVWITACGDADFSVPGAAGNRGPEAVGTIPERTLSVGETVAVDVSPYFSDPDGDALSYTPVSSNAGLVTVSVAGSSVTVASVASGVATVTVTAHDPHGLLAQQRFQVTVPNRAPEVLSPVPSQTLHVGQTASVDASVHFRDPDGDPVTYLATSANPEVATVAVSAATITIRATAAGVANVTVTATDPQGLAAQQRFAVTVTAPNLAPEAVGTIPAQTVGVGRATTLDARGYFRDPDGDALIYTAASSAAGVVAVSVSGSTLILVGVSVGTASVTVTATDPAGLTAAQGIQVTASAATPNRAPEAVGTIPARTLTVGQSTTLDVSPFVTDPDGDALTYTAASSAAGVVTVSVSGSALTLSGVSTGTASVTVTAADPDGLTARLSFGVTVTRNGFQIELVFASALTGTQKAVVVRAAERWMTILAPTELEDRPARRRYCGSDPRFERFAAIDDLMIVVVTEEMAGRTLARAGPCWTRGPTGLPSYGYIIFNSARIDELEGLGRLERLASHEIAHVLGLGTIWEALGLLENPASEDTSPDTHFVGPLAIAAFDDAGGTGYAGAKVPVENTGGLGNKNGHWREAVFGDELMTGWFYGRPKPLSAITLQSLADLGYTVDMTAADSYRLPAADAAAALDPARRIPHGDDVGRGPIVVEGPDGRIMRVIPGRDSRRPRRD